MQSAQDDDVRRARQGDREAITRLLARHQVRLARLAEQRLGSLLRRKLRVSDVLQSTFVDVMRSLQGFPGQTGDEFEAWVVRILENNIRDKARFFARERRRSEVELDLSALTDRASPDSAGPEARLAALDDLQRVSVAIDRLPEEHRQVILRRFVDEADYETIARETGRSPGAARVLVHRARAALLLEIDRAAAGEPGAEGARAGSRGNRAERDHHDRDPTPGRR
jgi:RNA polymerase sigma-70 factor (ECF subfamily)